ncbi:hypothetical protein GmHk_16G046829 [Glycine max]|nr:hypothetical protein GmHk_16G046829 [Glycine max]
MKESCTNMGKNHPELSTFYSNLRAHKRSRGSWTTHPSYDDLVTTTWNHALANALYKLGQVKTQSELFNKEAFGNIFRRKRHLETRI